MKTNNYYPSRIWRAVIAAENLRAAIKEQFLPYFTEGAPCGALSFLTYPLRRTTYVYPAQHA